MGAGVKKGEVDVLNGRLVPSIIKFTLPVAASSILQQLFNAADSAAVGHFAESNALAAVGTNSEPAALRMRIILAIEPLCAVYEVLAGVLRGKGCSLQPAVTAMAGVCAVRILWILFVFSQIHTLSSLFIIFPVSWCVTNVMMLITYRVFSPRIVMPSGN